MNHIEGSFDAVRDLSIYYQAWLPEHEAEAVLLIVHGLGEHSGRYGNVVDHFVPLGYAVYGFDLVGHGKSEGAREFVQDFTDYTATLNTYYGMVKAREPERPLFLLGHSMGGLIASYYLLDHQSDFQGAILSAPGVKVSDTISQSTIIMGKIASVLAPKMGVLPLDASAISRDPQVVEAYQNDPLVFHGKTPARLAAEMLQAVQTVTAEAHRIALPFIVLQGTEDKLVDPAGAQMLYEKASSPDKTLKLYEGLYHEVFNEPEREQVLRDVEAWLAAHV